MRPSGPNTVPCSLYITCESTPYGPAWYLTIFLWWERQLIVLLFSGIYDQTLCFLIGRERLLISFHCCRICFQILFEETFTMLFNLSGCSSAENSCNLHATIAIFFIFMHKYILCSSCINLPLFILLFWKLAGATYPDPNKAGIENKLEWQVIVMPNGQWSIWRVKNEKRRQVNSKNEH